MARDYPSMLEACLRVYLDRTERAKTALEASKFPQFFELMRLRSMAFHNFRAIDANARLLGYDVSSDPVIIDIFERISACEQELFRMAAATQNDTSEQLRRIDGNRKRIGRYKSRSVERKNLVQTV
jgi:hypothetical protein